MSEASKHALCFSDPNPLLPPRCRAVHSEKKAAQGTEGSLQKLEAQVMTEESKHRASGTFRLG